MTLQGVATEALAGPYNAAIEEMARGLAILKFCCILRI